MQVVAGSGDGGIGSGGYGSVAEAQMVREGKNMK